MLMHASFFTRFSIQLGRMKVAIFPICSKCFWIIIAITASRTLTQISLSRYQINCYGRLCFCHFSVRVFPFGTTSIAVICCCASPLAVQAFYCAQGSASITQNTYSVIVLRMVNALRSRRRATTRWHVQMNEILNRYLFYETARQIHRDTFPSCIVYRLSAATINNSNFCF